MGQMTRSEILSEGMLLAGRDDIEERVTVYLQTWLDSVAGSWPWPMNTREKLNVPVAASTAAVAVGNGSGGVTNKILRILDNVWCYSSDYRSRQRVRLNQLLSTPGEVFNPLFSTGHPMQARLTQPSGFGSFTLTLSPVPDKDYLLLLDYVELPPAMSGGSSIPWYPNDFTMIQLVTARTMLYDNGPDGAYQQAISEVADMLKADRVRYGSIPGQNDTMQLDGAMFK